MNFKKDCIFFSLTITIVLLFFLHTLTYPWKNFDDNIIFQETVLPIPKSFSEIFEYIKLFGLNHHFEASNPFYSSIANLRSEPFNFFIMLIVLWLFQKNAFLYHLLSLSFHILNTCLLFLILNNIYSNYIKLNSKFLQKIRVTLISILTLFWALNPLNVESILLSTNWPATLSYFFCLLVFYLSTNQDSTNESFLKPFGIFVLFLTSLFICEHTITFPAIIFFYVFIQSNSLKAAIKKTLPLLFATMPFITYFLLSQTKSNFISTSTNDLQLFLERIFWLSPQIFFHFIKLILLPLHLSIDQTAFVSLSKSLLEPYAMFCSIFMYSLLLITLISLINIKRSFSHLFVILFMPFFIALLPFLHIISPIYNLASERYLYFCLLFLILGISNIIFFFLAKYPKENPYKYFLVFLVLIFTVTYSFRAYARTLDWKDSNTLLNSTINISPNNLLKGLRQESLASSIQLLSGTSDESLSYTKKAITSLKKAFIEFKDQSALYEQIIPKIIKFYGLDPQTLLAKSVFLLAFCSYDLNNDPEMVYKIIYPYINYSNVTDTQILKFYYKILFLSKRIDDAERLLLQNLKQNKINPALYIALSDLSEYKYKDLKQTENYLLLSHKYFPYEQATLFGLQRLYRSLNNPEKFAFYSYLYGLRIHDPISLKDAAYIYIRLGNKDTSKIIINKLLKYYPIDEQTLRIKILYEQNFGGVN